MGGYDNVKRNSLMIVIEDLKKHEVKVVLPGENGERRAKNKIVRILYLIELIAKTNKAKEFNKIFRNELNFLQKKMAKKVFDDQEAESVYGVLIDHSNRIVFAFNREFADYDRVKQEIVFKNPDDIIAKQITLLKPKKKKSILDIEDMGKLFPREGDLPRGLMKYGIPDKD